MILKYMQKRDWITTFLCIFFIVIQIYLDLRIPEYMSGITEAIGSSEPPSVIWGYGVEMILCAVISFIISLLAGILAVITSASLCRTMRKRMFSNVSRFTPEDVSRFSVDSLITRCSNDVMQLQNFIAQALQVIVKTPIISVWALVKISGAEWQWTVVTATGVIILAILISFIIISTRPKYRKIPELTDNINHYALEHLTGLRVVRSYNAERFQEEKFEEASIEMMENSIYIWKRGSFMPALSSGTSNFLTLAIYWTGIILIASSTDQAYNLVLFSNMIVFSSYAIQVIGSFLQLSFLIQTSARALASSKRVNELLHYEPIIIDGEYDGEGVEPGTIEFEHVDFRYPGSDHDVLKDISFKVGKGQTLAVVGATGSGKSTIISLILRSYLASAGTVLVDGMDVKGYSHSSLFDRISYVPQTSTVFTGTIEDNVNYGSTSKYRDIEDVRRALEVAQASDFVMELSEKESFKVSEGGHNLSGGQKQRITIARAICKRGEFCILDDPFSALDMSTDKRLRKALAEECVGTTNIIVTQRISTVVDADIIIVLDEGHIVGKGRHGELLQACPQYRDMAMSQMVEGAI